jgi:PKD domain
VRRFASASAVLATALAALTVGGATASTQACANSTPPAILPEPELTLGATNVIRWEHVAQSCWDNEGADGKDSTSRKFDIVVTNVANGVSEWTTVSGEDETDVTISGSEFPYTSQTGIEGRRFTYKVRRSELVCNSGNSQTGICAGRTYKFSPFSPTVSSTQDSIAPSATLELGFGGAFTRFLSVPASVAGAGSPAWMQFGTDPALPCGGARVRTPTCVAAFSNGTQVELAPGPDGERQVFGRVWDDARKPDGDPGPIVFGLPPGNASTIFRDTIVVDRTGPAYTLRASTTQVVVGGNVLFEMVNPIDGVGAPGSGVNAGLARWNFGDGSAVGTGLSANHSFAATGTYNVVATLGDQLGNLTDSQPLRITVTAAPVPPTPVSTPTTGGAGTPAAADRTAPSLTGLSVVRRRGVPTRLSFRVSERSTLLVQVRRLRPLPARVVAALRPSVRAGRGGISLGRGLARPGRYRITVAARDAAGNVSRPRTLTVATRAR